MKLIDCDPVDDYETILECDNTEGIVDTSCSYSQTIGTQYTDEISEMNSIDIGIQVGETNGTRRILW
jgi:hypothetical protein